jgi:molybdopterin molybdotransferase
MITVQEASRIILSNLFKPSTEVCSFRDALGKVLAEDVTGDRDLPPFNRVTMDGIAIDYQTWKKGKSSFLIEFVMAAGDSRRRLKDQNNAVEVMTGAMLPEGTDTVIRYEDLEIKNSTATIRTDVITQGQCIHFKGIDSRKGDVLIEKGTLLSPAEIALLASLGKSQVNVFAFPKTALISSGDELVDVDSIPLEHQIRRSNTYALEASMKANGWTSAQFHMRDEENELSESLEKILAQYDVLILSGGVSQGKFDFIPKVLEKLGVERKFHQVSQRPGKPLWFGVSKFGKVVFALPGNPVSTFMCFYRYVQPWITESLGLKSVTRSAILGKDFKFPPNLTYFLQVKVENENGKQVAYPDAGGGSGDFVNLGMIDGFLELPLEKSEFKAGEVFPYIAFRL